MKQLSVIYNGWGERWKLGTLADNGTDLLFEYSEEALKQGLELSPRHLKLQARAYGGFPLYLDRLPGLIADSLPDGWGLLLMDKVFRLSGRKESSISPLDRLAYLGDHAMGALSFEPEDVRKLPQKDLTLLELARGARDVLAGKSTVTLRQLALMGGSPHGARPKVMAYIDESTAQTYMAPGEGRTPWLVKFPAQREH